MMQRSAWIALVATVLMAPFAEAVPRRAPGAVRAPQRVTRRAPQRPAPPARPVVDLQLAGLSTAGERRFPAVLHAIRRDALPAAAACVAQFPAARGVVSVTLTPSPRGRQAAAVESPFPAEVARCFRDAVSRVTLPPREIVDDAPTAEHPPDEPVRFELRVRLPAVGPR